MISTAFEISKFLTAKYFLNKIKCQNNGQNLKIKAKPTIKIFNKLKLSSILLYIIN